MKGGCGVGRKGLSSERRLSPLGDPLAPPPERERTGRSEREDATPRIGWSLALGRKKEEIHGRVGLG